MYEYLLQTDIARAARETFIHPDNEIIPKFVAGDDISRITQPL